MPTRNAVSYSEFQSTPSARRATKQGRINADLMRISIHALREEGDLFTITGAFRHFHFNPRPPRGGRLHAVPCAGCFVVISIHALREEGDVLLLIWIDGIWLFQSTPSARRATTNRGPSKDIYFISIHALREEGDLLSSRKSWNRWRFQSTPSARRATLEAGLKKDLAEISIHALREEGDDTIISIGCVFLYFNPRPPRGGRPIWTWDGDTGA